MAFQITPLAEPLGAEVFGWMPEQPLAEQELAQLLRALRRHLVLIFRGQPSPTEEALIQLGALFGELAPGAEIFGDPARRAEILPITNLRDERGDPLGTASSAALLWHLDYSYMPRVAKETFLEAVEIPEAPCPTHFCDNYSALETLPARLVKRLRKLSAGHDVRGAVPPEDRSLIERDVERKRDRDRRLGVTRPPIPRSQYPVIRCHPDSGRECLYVSPGMTTHVVGLEASESRELLASLYEHQIQPELVYTHQWRVGDLVLFDAFGVMHARDRIPAGARRYMRQMSTLC